MRKLSLLALPALAFGQPVLTLSGPATAKSGASISVALSSSQAGAAMLQWSLTLPTGFKITAATAGAASTAASKNLSCTADFVMCIDYGLTTTAIGTGVIANYTILVPPTATGPVSIGVSGPMGASPTALAFPIVAGAPLSITTKIPADLNGDGKVDSTDLNLMISEILSGGACPDDQDGDGKCTVIDAMVVLLKVLGL